MNEWCQVTIIKKDGDFAKVNVYPLPQPSSGYFAILKKVSGSWIVVFTGNGTISKEEAEALGLPQSLR